MTNLFCKRITVLICCTLFSVSTSFAQSEKASDKIIADKIETFYNQNKYDSIFSMLSNSMQTFLPADKNKAFFADLKSDAGQITGKNFNPVELAKELCLVFNKKFTELTEDGFENIYTTYLDHLYKRKATVKLKKDNIAFEALIESVSPSGKLIVQHAFQEEFNFGDLEWVIK